MENVTTENAATENATTENAATENATTENATMENVTTENATTENAATKNAATKNVLKIFLNRLFNEYLDAKTKAFAGNELGKFVRSTVCKKIYDEKIVEKEKYKVRGSVGQFKNWATVPWLAIFIKKITKSPQSGVFIAYLLSQDGKRMYLSLMQGCSGKEATRESLQTKAKNIHDTIKDLKGFDSGIIEGFGSGKITLGDDLSYVQDLYQYSTIFYKEYKKNDVPEESVLREDLKKMLKIYDVYFENIWPKSSDTVDETNSTDDEDKTDSTDDEEKKNSTNTDSFYLNTILYGPPGTGKTYNSAIYAVAICNPDMSLDEVSRMPYNDIMKSFNKLKTEKRVAFITFHQSYGYEEFIEGIKPKLDSDSKDIEYTIKKGVFKEFCERASKKKTVDKFQIRDEAVVWNVILGGSVSAGLKQKCFDEGTIRIGWNKFPQTITDETENLNDKARRILLNFQDEIQIGDIVAVRSSQRAVDGIGVVIGGPEYDTSVENFPRKRKVNWLSVGKEIDILDLNGGIKLDRKSIYPLNRINAGDLLSRLPKDSGIDVNDENKPYVFIIDEINRGNISKIFGELITLIEPTKRKGASEAMEVILPYSQTSFSVPKNVYLIGTMNTADRSIALMDTALRRRFRFVEMMPNAKVLENLRANVIKHGDKELDVAVMLDTMNKRIECLYDREHTIGHAFFTGLKDVKDELKIKKLADIFMNSIIPLLQEYFYEDYSKIMLVLGDNNKKNQDHKFILDTKIESSIFSGDTSDIDIPEYFYSIQKDAFYNIDSYIEIMGEKNGE